MKRKWMISFLAGCLLLSGCSGLKNIQDVTYVVAIGMDYDEEKEEYIAYLQSLNFANVAKVEGGKPTEPIPIFIASATGETLNLAVGNLYKKSEPPLFFGHVETLVLSQRIVRNHFKEVIVEIGRNRSLRHTLRVMTTDENIREVFNIKALFNYPAIYTVLFRKEKNEVYLDELKPMALMNFLRAYYEPMGVAKLPNVKIDSQTWKAEENYPIVFFDGYAIFQQQKFKKVLPFKDAVYVNWLLEKKVSLDQRVEDEGKLVAAMKLATPKMKVKYKKGTTTPKFSLEVSVPADLVEKIKDIPEPKLKKLMEDDIRRKITSIYKRGVKNKTDLLNVGEKWYRKHPKQYRELKKSTSFYLDKDSLTNIKVKVQIFHFNSYKYEQDTNVGF
ncbi:Ger(x)C family spore germination protein [Neobacillus drentensis]|uniref:Ger(x)C family spore germination protein n=1 Tax=Neobacillus drentensis TaxID=220684 RepID=UPI0030039D56